MAQPLSDLLSSICSVWTGQIERAKKVKERQFDKTARRAWKFYGDSDHEFLFRSPDGSVAVGDDRPLLRRPDYVVSVNLVSEYCRMMLPYIHYRIPHRQVQPRRPMMPVSLLPFAPMLDQQRQQDAVVSDLLGWVLNYTPSLFRLFEQTRLASTEALVKGRGIVWHEMVDGLVGSFYDTVDDLLVDPDSEQWHQAGWICRRRRLPAHVVSEIYRIPTNKIRGSMTSERSEARHDAEDQTYGANRNDPDAKDICTFYEVYSRIGLGGAFDTSSPELKAVSKDAVGRHVYLAVMPGMDSPLNFHRDSIDVETLTEEDVKSRLAWPIPFHGNYVNPWPCTPLDFYRHPRRNWPTSPLESSLPLQTFIDVVCSFLMGRVSRTCRDLIFASEGLDSRILDALRYGKDQEVITHDQTNAELHNLAHVLQFPSVNPDLFKTLELAQELFRQNTGLVELMYGASSRQMRSSAEAQIKQQNMSVRPEDMADRVESWMTDIAAAEATGTRLLVSPQRFGELAGEPSAMGMLGPLSQAWSQLVNTDDPRRAAAELAYTVEAGSGRKKNLGQMIEDMGNAMQFIMPHAVTYMQMSGDPSLVNGLIRRWGEVHQFDVNDMMIPPPPPPQPMPEEAPPQ